MALNAKVKRAAQNLNPTNKTHLAKKTFVDADNHKDHLSMFPLNFQNQRSSAQEHGKMNLTNTEEMNNTKAN
ncbi:hypothetical protein FCV52_21135 [Vibrio kanaloae]|uniref:Uncharacterized protein n=1 Tax=Vibrio kanaloae TaxID=170673 RepID=A0A4U1YMW3_9VIBR|nr:hypothetical protein FCV52_21135 [Vibrio kanaloae]